MQKTKLSLAVAKITSQKAIGFTLAGLLAAAMANATTLDSKLANGVHKLLVGDYDGDQKTDVLWQGRKEDQHELIRSSGVHVQRWKDGFLGLDWNRQDVNLIVGDFNGDAAADVLLQNKFSGLMSQVMHAEFDGLFGKPVQTIGDYHQGFRWDEVHHNLIVGDFNGDMRDDVFLQGHKNSFRHGLSLASDKGTFDTIAFDFDNQHLNLNWTSTNYNIFAGDFDGNGQSELLLQPKTMGYVSHINSKKHLLDTLQQSLPNDHLGLSWLPKDHRLLVGDFNGDGKDDVFLLTTDNMQKSVLIPSDGQAFSRIEHEIDFIPKLNEVKDVLVGDFDADGVDDIVLVYQGGDIVGLMVDGSRKNALLKALRNLGLIQNASQFDVVNGRPVSLVNTTATGINAHASTVQPLKQSALMQAQTKTGAAIKVATGVGRLEGQGSVNGGAASYTIPIAVPPGINGVQPGVSLQYSSRAGNGVAGMGWSVSAGESSIHRCSFSVAQTGTRRGVTMQSNDRLCLDGQLLINVSGSYGATNTVYRTELESFVRIKQTGSIDSLTSQFDVEYPSGEKREYRFVNQLVGHTAPMSWHLSKSTDSAGNSMTWQYSLTNGEMLLDRIEYTQRGTTTGRNKVEFVYLDRADK